MLPVLQGVISGVQHSGSTSHFCAWTRILWRGFPHVGRSPPGWISRPCRRVFTDRMLSSELPCPSGAARGRSSGAIAWSANPSGHRGVPRDRRRRRAPSRGGRPSPAVAGTAAGRRHRPREGRYGQGFRSAARNPAAAGATFLRVRSAGAWQGAPRRRPRQPGRTVNQRIKHRNLGKLRG